jgi:hypothetical protein
MQEDNDARFDWSGPKRRRAAIKLGWEDIVVTPTDADATTDADPTEIAVEELPGGAVAVEHIDPGSVHQRPH